MRIAAVEEKMIGRDTQYMASAPQRRKKAQEVDEMLETKNIKTPLSPKRASRYGDLNAESVVHTPITNIEVNKRFIRNQNAMSHSPALFPGVPADCSILDNTLSLEDQSQLQHRLGANQSINQSLNHSVSFASISVSKNQIEDHRKLFILQKQVTD
jgi:hypothetical protein